MFVSVWRIFVLGIVAVGLLSLVPSVVYAQLVPCEGLDTPGDPRPVCTVSHLFAILVNIFNFLLELAGVVLLLVVIVGGVRMIIFHFTEQPETELVAAKQMLTQGIFGFAIIAGAVLIVNAVLLILGLNCGSDIEKRIAKLGFSTGCTVLIAPK